MYLKLQNDEFLDPIPEPECFLGPFMVGLRIFGALTFEDLTFWFMGLRARLQDLPGAPLWSEFAVKPRWSK